MQLLEKNMEMLQNFERKNVKKIKDDGKYLKEDESLFVF